MEKAAIKDLVYGGLEELINNRKFYHASSVGAAYSKFTEEGNTAVLEFLNLVAWNIKQAEEADLNFRAKQQVIETLKG